MEQRKEIESKKTKIQNYISSETPSTEKESIASLLKDYHELQNQLSYCRTFQILKEVEKETAEEKDKPLLREKNFDDKLLLHIIGDVFGKESEHAFSNRPLWLRYEYF